MPFRTIINGRDVREINRDGVGWVSLFDAIRALGLVVRRRGFMGFEVQARPLAELLKLPHGWDKATETFWIGQPPLPPLPAEPVGADIPPWIPVTPAIAGGPGNRSAALYERIIQQFRVSQNPRYAIRDTSGDGIPDTHCDAFVCDVTGAMGCPIPFWVNQTGQPARPGQGTELDANGTVLWLRNIGPDYGYRPIPATHALEHANAGRPVVAALFRPGGIGHLAMVRPGKSDPAKGPPIAQAGAVNSDTLFLADGFGAGAVPQVEYFVHD